MFPKQNSEVPIDENLLVGTDVYVNWSIYKYMYFNFTVRKVSTPSLMQLCSTMIQILITTPNVALTKLILVMKIDVQFSEKKI